MNTNHTTDRHVLYLSDELSAAEAESVRGHLQQCPSCRSDVEEQRQLLRAYSKLPDESASDITLAKITTTASRLQAHRNASNAAKMRKPAMKLRIRFALIVCSLSAAVIAGILLQPSAKHLPAARQKPPQVVFAPPGNERVESAAVPSAPSQKAGKTVRTARVRHAKTPIPVTKMYSAIYSESSVDSDLRYMRNRLAHLAILVSDRDF